MVSSAPTGSGLPIGLMPGALPSDHASRQTLSPGHCHPPCCIAGPRDFSRLAYFVTHSASSEKTMPRPLKVFQAHLGFYDTAVAAPSRAAALKAWGSRQNLFREGVASETKDAQAVTAALAKPGVVLRRPVGTNAPFSENPDLPNVPKLPKKAPPTKTQAKPVPPP